MVPATAARNSEFQAFLCRELLQPPEPIEIPICCSISASDNSIAFILYATKFSSAGGNELAALKLNGEARLLTLDLRSGTVGSSHARAVTLSSGGRHAAVSNVATHSRVLYDPSRFWPRGRCKIRP